MTDEERGLQITLQRIKTFIDAFRSYQSKDYMKSDDNDDYYDNKEYPDDPFVPIFHHLHTKNVHFWKSSSIIQTTTCTSGCSVKYLEILKEAIVPLLQSLNSTLKRIDQLSISQQQQQQKQQQQQQQSTSQPQGSNDIKKSKRRKPTAPPGMLSIAQYTDIACLLEYFLYFLIYPFHHLYNILPFPIPIRVQKLLPKSLRGRMAPGALQLLPFFPLPMQTQTQSEKLSDEHSSPGASTMDISLLQSSIFLFADTITQSRFRPMLLPRHLSDLYALIFLHNHIFSTKSTSRKESISSSISLEPYFTPMIEGTIVAKSLQSLLYTTNNNPKPSSSSSSPQITSKALNRPLWLRSKVTYWLNRLATMDLPSILYVFVHAAHYLPGATVTTAALHLARALLIREKRIEHHPARMNHNEYETFISPLVWKQLIWSLESSSSSSSSSGSIGTSNGGNTNEENNIEMSGRLVMISLLPLLSSPQSYIQDILLFPENLTSSQQQQIPKNMPRKKPERIGIQRLKHLLPVLPPPPYRNHVCEIFLKHGTLDMLISYAVSIWSGIGNVMDKKEVVHVIKALLEYFMEDGKVNGEKAVKQSVVYLVRLYYI